MGIMRDYYTLDIHKEIAMRVLAETLEIGIYLRETFVGVVLNGESVSIEIKGSVQKKYTLQWAEGITKSLATAKNSTWFLMVLMSLPFSTQTEATVGDSYTPSEFQAEKIVIRDVADPSSNILDRLYDIMDEKAGKARYTALLLGSSVYIALLDDKNAVPYYYVCRNKELSRTFLSMFDSYAVFGEMEKGGCTAHTLGSVDFEKTTSIGQKIRLQPMQFAHCRLYFIGKVLLETLRQSTGIQTRIEKEVDRSSAPAQHWLIDLGRLTKFHFSHPLLWLLTDYRKGTDIVITIRALKRTQKKKEEENSTWIEVTTGAFKEELELHHVELLTYKRKGEVVDKMKTLLAHVLRLAPDSPESTLDVKISSLPVENNVLVSYKPRQSKEESITIDYAKTMKNVKEVRQEKNPSNIREDFLGMKNGNITLLLALIE